MKISGLRTFRKHIRSLERAQRAQMENSNCCCDLTLPQCHVLLELGEVEETTTRPLADILKLDASTLSRTIDSLVKASLVVRREHPKDRRFVVISLSDQGRHLCEEINRRNDSYYSEVLKQVPEEERQGVIRNVALLAEAMTAVEQAQKGGGR